VKQNLLLSLLTVRSVERMWRDAVEWAKENKELSQAETSPPEAPRASRDSNERKAEGRKVAAFEAVKGPSLDSWSPTILGLAETRSDRTASHLSLSPSPRTFQEPKIKQTFPFI
jgi:hypothetical protein